VGCTARSLKAKKVEQLSGVNYETHRRRTGCTSASAKPQIRTPGARTFDNVVICAGQEPVRDLEDGLRPQRH